MKKGVKSLMVASFLLASLSSLAAEVSMEEIGQAVNSIEQEYQELLMKEAEKKVEFQQEKAQLEEQLALLKAQGDSKEKMMAKLDEDSQIRWHRKEYKKLAKDYEAFYKRLEGSIQDKEQQIHELDTILQIMN